MFEDSVKIKLICLVVATWVLSSAIIISKFVKVCKMAEINIDDQPNICFANCLKFRILKSRCVQSSRPQHTHIKLLQHIRKQ